MARIIVVSNQKGGVGKSTLAYNVAIALSNGLSVKLLDTDLQGSLTALLMVMDGISLLPIPESWGELKGNPADIVIIDTPPYLSDQLPDILAIADFVIVPTKPSYFDVLAIRETVEILKKAKSTNPDLKAGIVLNMVPTRGSLTSQIKNLLAEQNIQVLKTEVTQRISYIRTLIQGSVMNGKDQKAKDEILNLSNEVLNRM